MTIPLVLFTVLGLYYSAVTPLWNPPDEERHFAYCEYIAQNRALPVHLYDLEQDRAGMAFHPPLYYAIGSLLCGNNTGLLEEEISYTDAPGYLHISHPQEAASPSYAAKARSARLLRMYSLALSMLTVALVYLLALTVFPGEVVLASATAIFVAANPQFLHISASVSSDNLAAMLSTAYLWSLVTLLREPCRISRQFACGVLLGLCFLSKSFTLFYVPVTLFVVPWVCRRCNPMRSCSMVVGTALLVGGWWYVRNWLQTGDPLVSKTALAYFPWFVRHTALSATEVKRMLSQTFISFFGCFGAFQFSLRPYHLYAYGCVMLLGTAGVYPLLLREPLTSFQYRALGILFCALLGGAGSFLLLNIQYIGSAMGRYLFVVIAPIAILTCAGLRSLVTRPRRIASLAVLSLLMFVLSLDVLFRVLKPAYADTSLVPAVDQPLFSLPSPEIHKSSIIGQTFTAPLNNLSAVRVMFSKSPGQQEGEIIFSLSEKRHRDEVIRQASFPLKRIQDNTQYFFVFPPLASSRGKEYILYISAPSLDSGGGLSLWHEPGDCYAGGSMLVNGEPATGDLYFSTWSFTGDHPRTDWQGKRELVIQQGLYVEIREIQLYYEQSRTRREKTVTHQKILRLQKALHNRKALL